jgi:hypothetical protein
MNVTTDSAVAANIIVLADWPIAWQPVSRRRFLFENAGSEGFIFSTRTFVAFSGDWGWRWQASGGQTRHARTHDVRPYCFVRRIASLNAGWVEHDLVRQAAGLTMKPMARPLTFGGV